MFEMLALAGLNAGASLLGGIGKSQASAKQARLQMIADENARVANAKTLEEVNAKREALGRELLSVPEVVTEDNYTRTTGSTENRSWVDTDAMMAAADKAGFNPVTWLNAGGMQAYTQSRSDSVSENWSGSIRSSVGHNAADAYKLMVPEYSLSSASQIPQQHSMLEAVGGAATAGLSTFTDLYKNQQAISSREAMFDKQLAAIAKNAGVSYGNSINGGGNAAPGGAITLGGATGVNLGLSSNPGAASGGKEYILPYTMGFGQPAEYKGTEVTNPSPLGGRVSGSSGDAQKYEDRYGEGVGFVSGIFNTVDDTTTAWTGKPLSGWGRTYGYNIGDYPGATNFDKVRNWWNGAWTNQSGAMSP